MINCKIHTGQGTLLIGKQLTIINVYTYEKIHKGFRNKLKCLEEVSRTNH